MVSIRVLKPGQASGGQSANHGSMGALKPIDFLGCPRGHSVKPETVVLQPNMAYQLDGYSPSNPERLKNRLATTGMKSGMSGSVQALKLLAISVVPLRNVLLSSRVSK